MIYGPGTQLQSGWARVAPDGWVHLNHSRLAAPEEWAYAIGHALLHLGMGHFRNVEGRRLREWNAACDVFAARFLTDLKFGRVPALDSNEGRTFGVLLDTSGSMDRHLLAKALGAIASYSISGDVRAVRVVFCDAATYDQGYMAPEEIADRVQVKGRGGTVLQPGVNLIEHAEDFPEDGPVLIITDGYCDVLRVRREHAYLLPHGHRLPFIPTGKVFEIR